MTDLKLLPPAQKKALVELWLRDKKVQTDAYDDAAQVAIDETRARQHDARAKAEAKVQSAKEEIQSAEEVIRQAEEQISLGNDDMIVVQRVYTRFISVMEEEKRKQRSKADAEIRQGQELIDKLDQEIKAHEASSTQDSA